MLKKHSQLFEAFFTATDLLVVSVAWTLSYWLRFSSDLIPVIKGVPPFADYLRMLIFVWLIWAFVFRRMGLYRPMRGSNRLREVLKVVRANSLSVVLLLAMTYLFREKSVPFSRLVFLIFFCVSTSLLVVSRSLIRSLLRSMRRRGYNLRYAVIIGSGVSAQQIAQTILEHPESGIELVGSLVNPGDGGTSESGPKQLSLYQDESRESVVGVPVLGTYNDLGQILAAGRVDQIIISLSYKEPEYLEPILSTIGDSMVDVKIVPDVQQFIQLGSEIEEFNGVPIVSLASTPLCGVNRVLKRGFDIVFGVLFLILFSPVMLIIALLVKLTSKGPVFFSQERVGLDGQEFSIYKFRTMSTEAEKSGARFAVPGDPRVTPLGRVLRKLSLDELPQLVNVIFGQMSLVGPRPERPVFIKEFRRHIPKYMLRHKVQAGMTGWAQVHGWRGNTSIEKRIEFDLYYIEHWSLALDLKIMFMTLVHGLRDRNAY